MKQTVVGVFDRYAAAQHAASLLQDRGIDSDCIHVAANADGTVPGAEDRHEDESLLTRVKNFFSGMVDDDDDTVGHYSEAVRRGGAVVKVEVDEDPEVQVAREALVSAGAVDIEEKVDEWRRAEGAASRPISGTAAAGEQIIPVVKEELQVGKRTVQSGGVRVYARTVEEPVRETLDLREERAHVERRPVDRPASPADLNAVQDRTIEVTESVERPVVQKSARVVEEVVVGKEVLQQKASIEDKVRHTEVEVESLGKGNRVRAYESFENELRHDFQTRYAAQGGAYEDYEPAYRFGHGLRNDQRYSGRPWDEVEGDARRDWATRYPDSPWERFKDAVRHAWERVTD